MPGSTRCSLIWTVVLGTALICKISTAAAEGSRELLVPGGEPLPTSEQVFLLPDSRFEALSFSHDGALLATAAHDGRVCIWELATGRPRRCMLGRADKPVGALSWSSDDSWLAAGQEDGHVEQWRSDGAKVAPPCAFAALPAEPALGRAITALVYTPGKAPAGSTLIAVGGRNHAVRSCTAAFEAAAATSGGSAPAPQQLAPLTGLPGTLYDHAAVDARGEFLAVSKHRMVGVWALRTGTRYWMDEALPSRVTALAMSPDGRHLVVGTLDGSLTLWSVLGGGRKTLTPRQGGAIRILAFTPDGSHLAAAGEEKRVSLYDTDSLALVNDFAREAPIDGLAFSGDGARLAVASADVGISIFSIVTGAVVQSLSGNADRVRAVAFSPSGALLATAAEDRHVRLFRRRRDSSPDWSLLCTAGPLAGPARALAFRPPDGTALTVSLEGGAVASLRTEDCAQSDTGAGTGESIPMGGPKPLAHSPDGRWLAVGTPNGELVLSNIETPSLGRRIKAHSDEVRAVAFVPGSSLLLASASLDKNVTLWDVSTGKEVGAFPTQAAGVRALAVSHDGKWLAMAVGKELSLWEVATRQPLATLSREQMVTALRISPDGSLLAAATDTGSALIFEVATRALRSTLSLPGDHSAAWSLDFHPESELLAVSAMGRLSLWQPKTGALQGQLFQGRSGWAYWQGNPPTGKLYRHDAGTLLYTRDPGGAISPYAPPRPAMPPQLTMRVEVQPGQGRDSLYAQLVVHIENAVAAGPAYWLRLEGSDPVGGNALSTQVGLTLPPPHQRLEPGESLRLSIDVWPTQKRRLPPREVRFCLALRHAFGTTAACAAPEGASVVLPIGPWWWQNAPLLALGGLALLGAVGGWLFIRSRRSALAHPAVRAVLAGQNPFQGASLTSLPALAAALRRAARFPGAYELERRALSLSDTTPVSLQRALRAVGSPAARAAAFAASLGDQPPRAPELRYQNAELAAYAIVLPPMSIHLPANSILIMSKSSLSLQAAIARCAPADLGMPKLAILLASPAPAAEAPPLADAVAAHHPETAFVFLSEESFLEILLARDELVARDRLRRAVITQVDIRQVIPYRDGGNEIPAGDSSFFFGRHAELERMLQLHERNFIVVGPRTMGKSSLLNALKWELEKRYPSISVLKYQLYSSSLRSLHAMDATIATDSPQAFYDSVMRRSPHHQIFLLDEADPLIAEESRHQYAYCNVMRALSGQRRASFVLAGYKDLYEATQIPDNPLRNFGEILHLGPLDPGSAERMILEPLSALGIQIVEATQVVDWLRAQTGCRPHLLAVLCSAIARLRPVGNRSPLGLAEIQQELLTAKMLHSVFGRWDGGAIHPLDRVLIRLALLASSPSHDDLWRSLKSHGISLEVSELEQSLTRLYSWHYALVEDSDGRLRCPVALFEYWLSEPGRNFVPGREWTSAEERLRWELERDLLELRSTRVAAPMSSPLGLGTTPTDA